MPGDVAVQRVSCAVLGVLEPLGWSEVWRRKAANRGVWYGGVVWGTHVAIVKVGWADFRNLEMYEERSRSRGARVLLYILAARFRGRSALKLWRSCAPGLSTLLAMALVNQITWHPAPFLVRDHALPYFAILYL